MTGVVRLSLALARASFSGGRLARYAPARGADATPANPQPEEQGLRLLSRLLVQPHRHRTCHQMVVQRATDRVGAQVSAAGFETGAGRSTLVRAPRSSIGGDSLRCSLANDLRTEQPRLNPASYRSMSRRAWCRGQSRRRATRE